jgi:hypothetical protein
MENRKKEWDLQMIKDFINPTHFIRRVGRTTILAKAFVELAEENPETYIILFDHYPGRIATENLIRSINNLIAMYNNDFGAKQYNARFNLIKNNEGWNIIYSYRLKDEIIFYGKKDK